MIKKNSYIVGYICKTTGAFSASGNPATHIDHNAARVEALRLANIYTNKRFVVLKVDGIVHASGVVWE